MASSSSPVVAFAVIASAVCVFLSCFAAVSSQDQNVSTDPSEARSVNSIFEKWRISALANVWNISGETCSGRAIDTTTTIDALNPFIKCDCSDGTTCHITALRVYALDVVGEIPEELWTLTHLTNLDIRQNYLTGSLPPAIGNLTRMQYMSFGINSLSGEIPKELGNLTELISLSLASNSFSGSIPSELGNLVKLQQLYIISSGPNGQIPPTFANLKNLKTFWASDMELTGKIPDFIGSWSQLIDLVFPDGFTKGLEALVWQLHENNCILGLADPRLSKDFNEEEVKRIVGISLLCTQASPSLRPAMSRVVAMLSGDIEVNTVTAKPGYLTDWKFDDVSSFMTGWATKGSASGTSHNNSSPTTTTVSGESKSPGHASKPILRRIFGEGR